MKLAKFSAKLVANFPRSSEGDFRAPFAGENRQKHFPSKLHRRFHSPSSFTMRFWVVGGPKNRGLRKSAARKRGKIRKMQALTKG